MNEVIIATTNVGKAKEFQKMLAPLGFQIKTLLDFPMIEEIDETGATFEENAILKAETVSNILNKIVIADDSGLVVDALGGRPGVFSARYAGLDKNDEANIDKVLSELENVVDSKRTARFYCAIAVAIPNQETMVVNGVCEGCILRERHGTYGFGYDPIFFVKEENINKAMAELDPAIKNQISHRAKALKKLENKLQSFKEA